MPPTTSVLLLLILSAATPHTSASWCVCKDGVSDAALQKTLDYACGAGADCNPIHSSGACYDPNNVKSHCSYAVNSYYQKKSSFGATCDFSGTASIVTSDPSVSGCAFPASSGAAGTTTTTPTTNVPPSYTTPSTRTPTTILPYSSTPTNGGLGGINTGLSPSDTNTNTDFSQASHLVPSNSVFLVLLVVLSGFVQYHGIKV